MDEQGQVSHTGALDQAKKVFSDESELKNIEDFLSTCAKGIITIQFSEDIPSTLVLGTQKYVAYSKQS